MDVKQKFLAGVLGKDGASALRKAVQRDSRLDSIVLPRAVIGWLSFVSRYEFEGDIPGVDNSYIQFSKSEDGLFSGSVAIGEFVVPFSKTDIYHLSSAILLALGEDEVSIDEDLKDLVLAKLGKSIDALAKAQEVARNLDKTLKTKKTKKEEEEEELDKTDLPGKAHQPTKQQGPQAPVPPVAVQPKIPKTIKKVPALKITKTESEKPCSVCDGIQFKDGKFKGCMCFMDLAKGIKTTEYSDGFALDFQPGFDKEAYIVLSQYFRN